METEYREDIIRFTLASRFELGTPIEKLTQSIARSISYDKELSRLSIYELQTGLQAAKGETQHHRIMAALRAYAENLKKEKESKRLKPEQIKEGNEVANLGFFLKCWDAYQRDGDLHDVRMLTVTFLSDWLSGKPEYLTKEEKDWCSKAAEKDAADTEGLTQMERDRKYCEAYAEATVLIVMNKFYRAMKKEPEKAGDIIRTWREKYTDYMVKTHGRMPDWSPAGLNRTPATKAFD